MPAPSMDRDSPSKSSHLSMDISKSTSIPMWDSSDPERAPPPLPLYPGSSALSSPTKPNTSAGIAAAAKAIVEKARESTPVSSYTSNPPIGQSPERQLIKGAHHRRFQSLQPGSVKGIRSYIDGNRSPERLPEHLKPKVVASPVELSRQSSRDDIFATSDSFSTPVNAARKINNETPTALPALRARPHSFMGESTPPSATMLALQTMQVPELPLDDSYNRPITPSGTPTRVGNTYDFSSQLLNLTTIATNLQKEMANLSRRSKDNATDLVSLKEATSQRDEDIRKSLKDLASQVQTSTQTYLSPPPNARGLGSFATSLLDAKPFNTPPSVSRSFDIPRASSVHSFLDDTRLPSPSPYSVEGAASVAMLEKIIREMVTKEGQDRLLDNLSELFEKSREENGEAAKKFEELAAFIKSRTSSQALVTIPNARSTDNLEGAPTPSKSTSQNDDLMKLLAKIKDSVSHAGGTSAEIKGIVRDLRGEVLGMGRELGRKLDHIDERPLSNAMAPSAPAAEVITAQQISQIMDESVADLKDGLRDIITQHLQKTGNTREISAMTTASNSDQMFAVVRHALAEHGHDLFRREQSDIDSGIGMDRDSVIDAVKEGLKDFEPNIELQQFGLEREEILTVLRQGLEDYANTRPELGISTIDKGEVYEAMQEALKDFRVPLPADALEDLRRDILSDVREALQQRDLGLGDDTPQSDHLRVMVESAVQAGLASHTIAPPRELEISRADLFDAVKASLDGSAIPFGGLGEQILQQMHELIDGMRMEFKQYSAANGRDTEQVLDAVKDGLESLRGEIENYVDRAQDVTGKDEIVDTVRGGLERLRLDVQGYCLEGQDTNYAELLDQIKTEFAHLHVAVQSTENTRSVVNQPESHLTAIVMAIKESMEGLKAHVSEQSRGSEHEDSHEDMGEAMKAEFDQLKAVVLNAHAADKSELIETIQDSMGALHSRLGTHDSQISSGPLSEHMIDEIHAEFAVLKESLHAIVENGSHEAILSAVRGNIEDMRTHLAADQNDASAEVLGAIKGELEMFRDSFASSLIPSAQPSAEKLELIHQHVRDIKLNQDNHERNPIPNDLLEAIHGEFEQLRNTVLDREVSTANEEFVDAIRISLDELRSDLERKIARLNQPLSSSDDLLDAINDGIESLRSEVTKALDKSHDMTVNYEILDLLKDGLSVLRADVDTLKSDNALRAVQSGQVVLADNTRAFAVHDAAQLPQNTVHESTQDAPHEGIEALNVLIHKLLIKVEALDATVQELPSRDAGSDAAHDWREQMAVVETSIRELQLSVSAVSANTMQAAPGDGARKEDTDAIETLLHNTKAQVDAMQATLPITGRVAGKEQLEEVEAVMRTTQETVANLNATIETSAVSRGDIDVIEVLLHDVKTAVDGMTDKLGTNATSELVSKADFDVLGIMCTEMKSQVEALVTTGFANGVEKSDIEQVRNLLMDFRESHDKLRDSYETDIAVTAKAFDDRKTEFEATIAQSESIKTALTEIKDEVMLKLIDNDSGVNTLGATLKELEDKIGHDQPTMDALRQDNERTHTLLELLKTDQQEAFLTQFASAAEYKVATVQELTSKLDTLFDGLSSRYDESQQAAGAKVQLIEDQTSQQAEVLESTRAMSEELRLSIDTLGAALTTFTTDHPAHVEKLSQDYQVVFDKIGENSEKLDSAQKSQINEHFMTRQDISQVLSLLNAVHNDMLDHNPRSLVKLQEVQAHIGQNEQTAQRALDVASEHQNALRSLADQLKAGFEESRSRDAERVEELRSTLPALMAPGSASGDSESSYDKYDDSAMHEKLNTILGHHESNLAVYTSQLEQMKEIHERVLATAHEVSAMADLQAKQAAETRQNSELEAQELSLLIERRTVQKHQIEDDITVLNDEKDNLQRQMEMLRAEKDALSAQKSRLNADVSSLETALRIRRDELHEMDRKAEQLERRVLEGVMNQSRTLLLSQVTKPSAIKKPTGRDLRVPSNASIKSNRTPVSTASALRSNHALTVKPRPITPGTVPSPNRAERRIMSLSQINHNVVAGGQALSGQGLGSTSQTHSSMMRSQSVRTYGQPRKSSWAGKRNSNFGVQDKENEHLWEEDEFNADESTDRQGNDDHYDSDTGTERRGSFGSHRRSGVTFEDDDRSSINESHYSGRPSYDSSRLSYDTGSYMTGSDIDRRTSLADSGHARGHAEDDGARLEDSSRKSVEQNPRDGKRTFAPPSDSGLGAELPTNTMVEESDYFYSGDESR